MAVRSGSDGFDGNAEAAFRHPAPGESPVPSPSPRDMSATAPPQPIQVDGRLDDDAWKAAPWTETFVDIEGDVKPRPRFPTRVKMLWDDNYFYVGALLEEPHVWGTLTKHDSVIFHDNDFEVFIDPDGDNHEYYEIEINALNTEWDLFLKKPYRNGGPAINEWEIPGLKTGVHVEGTLNKSSDQDTSWSVEFAFPWKVLAEYAHRPAPPRDGDQWRGEFLPGRVAVRDRRGPVSQGAQDAGGQLGLVAPGGHRHASARALGIRSVLDGRTRPGDLPARPGRSVPRSTDADLPRPERLSTARTSAGPRKSRNWRSPA